MATFDMSVAYARDMLARRIQQDALFGIPLRGTLAWDMLLVLFIADANGERLRSDQVIEQAGGSPEAARRWLAYLIQQKLVAIRSASVSSPIVTIAPHAVSAIEGYIERCLQSGQRFG